MSLHLVLYSYMYVLNVAHPAYMVENIYHILFNSCQCVKKGNNFSTSFTIADLFKSNNNGELSSVITT